MLKCNPRKNRKLRYRKDAFKKLLRPGKLSIQLHVKIEIHPQKVGNKAETVVSMTGYFRA